MKLRSLFSLRGIFAALMTALVASPAFAATGEAQFINYYQLILHGLGLTPEAVERWEPVAGALITSLLLIILGLVFRSSVRKAADDVLPERRFSLRTLVEITLEAVYNLGRDIIGHGFQRFLPLLAALFLFILVSNLTGLIPGFIPATDSMSTNVAMGLIVFLVYNFAGFKEHGGGYLKHFMGPLLILAPLMFPIELISHLVRPFSLSFRLYANLFGDHLLLGVFSGLTKLVIPVIFLSFGLLVAIIQTFVFTLLSGIYISMAVSHDH